SGSRFAETRLFLTAPIFLTDRKNHKQGAANRTSTGVWDDREKDSCPATSAVAPQMASNQDAHHPLSLALREVHSRLRYLEEVGLSYLTLDRPTRSLSGGETERVNLTTCLGSGLVNTLFVLDEPSVGLHARDTSRLVRILERLRDTGNTV